MITSTLLILINTCSCSVDKSPDPALQTVNKKTSLGHYAPDDLVCFRGIYVSQRIVKDLTNLLESAKKDGLTLKVVSGYRSYEEQTKTFNFWVDKELKKNPQLTITQAQEQAHRYSALPGHSEHQLGTTVDILSSENNYQFRADPRLQYITWLEKHSTHYNFHISYKQNNPEFIYEPWHLRWYPP
jgi:zinc D-Ala-D-Ala carboxypeptidase